MAKIPERIVLPRLVDASRSAVGKQQQAANGEETEMLIVGFTDAFKHLVINQAERRFLAGQCKLDGEEGFFVYLVLLFGAIAGPLLWGAIGSLAYEGVSGDSTSRSAGPPVSRR